MKAQRFFIILAAIAVTVNTFNPAFAQTSTERIALYCKVWGFLRYHHPGVAGGIIDWDSVFITHINGAMTAKDNTQLNTELSALIDAAGPDDNPRAGSLRGDIFTKNHDVQWLHASPFLNEKNREKLQYIYAHRNHGSNRFVKYNNYTDYSGEKPYDDMVWPTENYRLLFLARFWNAINYFDPYKFITEEDWNDVLPEFISLVRNVKDMLAYHKILLQLAVALHDGHAQLIGDDDMWGKYMLPAYITVMNDTVVITHAGNDSLCRLANIQQGDIIMAINGEPITKRIARFKPYTTSSGQVSLNRHLEYTLLCTNDTVQYVTIKRAQKTFTTKVSSMLVSQRNWQYINNYTANETGYKTIGDSIAYVYTMQIWDKNVDTILSLIHSKKAVIFDARSYTQNDAFYNIFGMFLSSPTSINYNTFIMPDEPGYFEWKLSPKLGELNNSPYTGMVIILADERCQSQGEYSVMALQTIPNSITIGSKTCGTDGVVSYIPMGGKLGITHSGYGIYYPDKTPTQQCGLRIDITVNKTVADVINGKDPAMEKALEYLKAKGIR